MVRADRSQTGPAWQSMELTQAGSIGEGGTEGLSGLGFGGQGEQPHHEAQTVAQSWAQASASCLGTWVRRRE